MEDTKAARHRGFGQSPFHTTDAILAFSLYLAGIPFYEDRTPCINIYDENILKRLGFVGLSIEEGVRKALVKKKKGHVEYGFKRTPELPLLLQAYKQQETQLKEDEGTAVGVVSRLLNDIAESGTNPFTVIRLACIILKMRVQFVNLWQNMEPLIRIGNAGDAELVDEEGGNVRRRFPGFRLVSLNASKETKDKLKL